MPDADSLLSERFQKATVGLWSLSASPLVLRPRIDPALLARHSQPLVFRATTIYRNFIHAGGQSLISISTQILTASRVWGGLLFLLCSNHVMSDRPASWRMPTPKQIEKWAAADRRADSQATGPETDMPPEYWDSIFADPRVATRYGIPIQQRRLSEIPRHVLRVTCQRCDRVVEIQKADAIRFFGQHSIWKDVGQKLLDQTCQNRTGRHEEDGCWPSFETS